jgi:hypothetical protein
LIIIFYFNNNIILKISKKLFENEFKVVKILLVINMIYKFLKLIIILIGLAFLLIVFWKPNKQAEAPLRETTSLNETVIQAETQNEEQAETQNEEQAETQNEEQPETQNEEQPLEEMVTEKILLSVPFTPQAPFGEWTDSRQQDGCEEASVLMAISWAKNQPLTRKIALQEIISISDYISEKYGESRDTELNDVLNWIIKDYFAYEKVELKENVTLEDLILELKKGRVIIAPMNGRALKNPNFTAPGPINHMLLIRGYDPLKKTFITNDPGTRNGELYEYEENLLYSALRTYPTGYHEDNPNPQKNIIVFWQ